MGLCYAPLGKENIHWPLDKKTGVFKKEVWKKWKKHDPLEFLKKRKFRGKFYVEAGCYDEYQLQWGARQISKILKCPYKEFEGGHFHLSKDTLFCGLGSKKSLKLKKNLRFKKKIFL